MKRQLLTALKNIKVRGSYALTGLVMLTSTITPVVLSSTAYAAAPDPFPSTNALNKTNNHQYVELVSKTATSVKLKFSNPTAFTQYFEVRKDNAAAVGTNQFGPCRVGVNPLNGACNGKRYLEANDYSYASTAVTANSSVTTDFTVTDNVAVRVTFGPERNWDFDWTVFNVAIAPSTPTNLRLANSVGVAQICGYQTNVNSITLNWDAAANAVSYNYKVTTPSGSVYGPINVGNVTTLTGPFNEQGLFTMSVQSVSADGLTSAWSSVCTATYDTTAPTTPTNGFPHNATKNTNDFYFTWDASIDVNPVTYEFQSAGTSSVDGNGSLVGAWNSISNGNSEQNNLTSPQIHSTGAPDGHYFWQVRSIDAAGNKSAWSTVWNMYIDTTAPVATVNDQTTTDRTPTITGTVNDKDATVSLAFGAIVGLSATVSPTANGSGTFDWSVDSTQVHAGIYTVTATVTDLAGNSSTATGNLTINKTNVSITAQNKSKTYGAANPALTYNPVAPLSWGEDVSVLGTISCTTTATASSPAGTYPITCTAPGNSDYNVVPVNGTLTINKKSLLVSAPSTSRVYGDVNPTFTPNYTGFTNGDDASDLTTPATCTSAATPTSPVLGIYTITCSGATSSNYNISYSPVPGFLTITRAPATITADDKGRLYGVANPTFTYSVTGLKNGQSASVLGTINCASLTGVNTPVGQYNIFCFRANILNTNPNYAYNFVNGTLTIGKNMLTVTANNKSRVYGDTNPAFDYTITGFVNGQNSSVLTTAPSCTSAANATSGVSGSPYAITCSGAVATNYAFNYVDGDLAITSAAVTVTADNNTRVYGDSNPTFTYTASGLKNGEDKSVLGPITCTSVGPTSSVAGSPYPITCSGDTNANYTVSYVDGSLTVTPAAVIVTANNRSKTYGSNNPSLTFTATGLKNGENKSVLGVGCTTTATQSSPTGTYPITCSGASNGNYNVSYVDGTLTVNKAVLFVFAPTTSREYGNANPTFNPSYFGFVNGDDASDLTTAPTCSSSATPNSPVVGIYLVNCSGGVSSNYSFTYIPGLLFITKAPVTITADDKTKVYGQANPAFTYTATGLKNGQSASVLGTINCTTVATAASAVNDYDITCVSTGPKNSNYAYTFVNGNLSVTKAILSVTTANQTRVFGASNPSFNPLFSGFVNGDTETSLTQAPTCTTAAINTSSAGTYPITCSGGLAVNYSFAFVAATLTVTSVPLAATLSDDNGSANANDVLGAIAQAGTVNANDDNKSGNVKSDNDNKSDDGQFLGLGWWWLLILAALAAGGLWWFLVARRQNEEE